MNGKIENNKCVCVDGYTGQNCSNIINICATTTCLYGGTCSNGKCICKLGFTGEFCQNKIIPIPTPTTSSSTQPPTTPTTSSSTQPPITTSKYLKLPKAQLKFNDNPIYWDMCNGIFVKDKFNKPNNLLKCFKNYFKILFPIVNPDYWENCNEGHLRTIYNMLDWYYTPFIIEPRLPYPLNNVDEISKVVKNSDIAGDRLRPLVGPYVDAYIQFFPMAAIEPVATNKNGEIYGPDETNHFIQVAEGSDFTWPDVRSGHNTIARPLMCVSFIQPYGITRQGFPSYAYVELVNYAFEFGGMQQRFSCDKFKEQCKFPVSGGVFGNSKLSTYDNILYQPNSEIVKDAYNKYAVPMIANNISGPGYIGKVVTDSNWGGPLVENYYDWKTTCNSANNSMRDGCLCLTNQKGISSLPSLPYPGETMCIKNPKNPKYCENLYYLQNDTKKPINFLDNDQPKSGIYRKINNVMTLVNIESYTDIAYCPPPGDGSYIPSCSTLPYDLFYPIKGYGKFLNLGRCGLYFNYVHALIAAKDRDTGLGIQFRTPFESILLQNGSGGCAGPDIGGWPCMTQQLKHLAGGANRIDQREILVGYVTVPRKDKFDNKKFANLIAYHDAINGGGGGRVDFSFEGSKFTSGVPQIFWEKDQKLGCGQTRWMKGEYDPFTKTILKSANEWMNPMDDNGRLKYIGEYFIQYYCPPELRIKNPNYNKNISDLYPLDWEEHVTIICGDENGTGSTNNKNKDTMQEFCIRWLMAFQLYGDTGIHEENSWPFGLYGVSGTQDSCIYAIGGALGWQSLIVTYKDAIGGQGDICEYPYGDSEVLFFHPRNCTIEETMSKGCGPLGPYAPPSTLLDGGINIADTNLPGSTITCFNQVTLDITRDIDRYLIDNFVAGVEDRSTISDTDINNQNYKLYGIVESTRWLFSLSEASTDLPAQESRNMYNPPKIEDDPDPVLFCNICPKSIFLNIEPTKPWVELTNDFKGQPGTNKYFNEGTRSIDDTFWKNWADNDTHKKYGCYTIY